MCVCVCMYVWRIRVGRPGVCEWWLAKALEGMTVLKMRVWAFILGFALIAFLVLEWKMGEDGEGEMRVYCRYCLR